MSEGYVAPEDAFRKLRAARGLAQTVYLYGATGYGKTELVRQYLANRRYRYLSCGREPIGLGNLSEAEQNKEKGHYAITVVDDLHLLKSEEGRKTVFGLVENPHIWLILISRSPIPPWLMPLYVKKGFLVIGEGDLCLKEKEIAAYLTAKQIPFTKEELAYVGERSQGNAYIMLHTALLMKEGKHPGPELTEEIRDAFADYLEGFVLEQLDSDLLEFLMQISVVEEFTLSLAEMVSGNCRVSELLERAAEAGNFLSCEGGIYRLRPVLVYALRKRAAKIYRPEEIMDHRYNAGLYYEMHDQIVPALAMFELCGRRERVKELLVRNARLNPGSGHYFELRRYYLQMEEEEVEKSVILMTGMSMLYSLLLQEKESEYWYEKLKAFAKTAGGG